MNGVHDLGGMHGFGPVERDPAEPPFEFDWVPAVIAMQAATVPAVANIDEFRHAIERMEPVHYLRSTYFEHWADAMIRYCLEKGVFTEEDFERRTAHFEAVERGERLSEATGRRAGGGRNTLPPIGDPSPWKRAVSEGHPHRREPLASARFASGQAVLTSKAQPAGHTRLPRYVRGRRGVIERYQGCFALPDAAAHGHGDSPSHLYSVRFSAHELWGPSAEPGTSITIDLFEAYLEATEH